MRFLAVLGLVVLLIQPAEAADDGRTGLLKLLPPDSVTEHMLPGEPAFAYKATAGTLPLRDGKGEIKAELFYVAYAAEPMRVERPLTFVFNGGPGAASAFLNLGALGPRIIAFGQGGELPPPPPRLVDNPDTWLRVSDLVFVDPVGTGFSRTAESGDEAGKAYWGVNQDADAMATFIQRYIARFGRALSPKFLVGESYGGFRAALLAERLQTRSGIAPNGLVLVSPVLEFALIGGGDYQALPWAIRLPSLAAASAIAEGITGDALAERMKDAEAFALGDYLVFLAAGSAAESRAPAIYGQVAQLTGLPLAMVARQRGRIDTELFIKERGRDRGALLSRYDAALGGPDPDPASPLPHGPDPVLDGSIAPWTSAFTAYVRDELGYKPDFAYELLNRSVGQNWDWGKRRREQAGVLDELTRALALNPRMRVLVVHGAADLVTPYLASSYLVRQMPNLAGAAPVALAVYPGGHMAYMRPETRRRFAEDAAALYRGALEAVEAR